MVAYLESGGEPFVFDLGEERSQIIASDGSSKEKNGFLVRPYPCPSSAIADSF
jgi:hypothetical protein